MLRCNYGRRKIRAFAAIAFLALLLPAAAQATADVKPPPEIGTCAPTKDSLQLLKKQYGETVVWFGEVGQNGPETPIGSDVTIVIAQRPDGKAWTILGMRGGTACVLESGVRSGDGTSS